MLAIIIIYFSSVVLMTLNDAQCKVFRVDIGGMGFMSDNKFCDENGETGFHEPKQFRLVTEK